MDFAVGQMDLERMERLTVKHFANGFRIHHMAFRLGQSVAANNSHYISAAEMET